MPYHKREKEIKPYEKEDDASFEKIEDAAEELILEPIEKTQMNP